jgi:hypothetical protein
VVSGYQVNGDARVGDFYQGLEGFIDDQRGDSASEEQISTVDDKVYLFCPGDIQNMMVIGEEVMTTPPPLYLRMNGVIKAEVSVGEEQDFDGVVGHVNLAEEFQI